MNIKDLIAPHLKEGELYAGMILGQDGEPDYHLVLLPSEAEDKSWDDAKAWAERLPGQQENFASIAEEVIPGVL